MLWQRSHSVVDEVLIVTGREKIEAAFTPAGSPQIAAVICYEGIYARDHWDTITACPWWWAQSPRLEQQVEWHRQVYAATGMDWFHLPLSYSREKRSRLSVEERGGVVYLRDGDSARLLRRPAVGGWRAESAVESVHPEHLAESKDEIDLLLPAQIESDPQAAAADGRGDLAAALLAEFPHLLPISSVSSPLWSAYGVWGFEGLMYMVASRPELVQYVCERELDNVRHQVRQAAALGAAAIWLEECFTDMVSPVAFERLNLPAVRAVTEEIRRAGMKSIYYYCGDPRGKWDLLLAAGADALAFEESKKGWRIDIEDVVRRVAGRCAVFGNLDAIGLLEHGSDGELAAEISRQIEAGRRNGSRFVMSLGSPVTPGTTVARVRRYCDLVHELGG